MALILITACALKIRSMYREFDIEQTNIEKSGMLKERVIGAYHFFHDKYSTDENKHIWMNIRPKLDFAISVIDKKDVKSRIEWYDRLFKTCFETEYRLRTRYDEPNYIVQPMNNLMNDLAEEQIKYIRENTDQQI